MANQFIPGCLTEEQIERLIQLAKTDKEIRDQLIVILEAAKSL